MREELYVETSYGRRFVSEDLINGISQYLIAKTETEEELGDLVMAKINEQDARKEAWKLAYKEVPLPPNSVPLEIRLEMQQKRNEVAEKYYREIMTREEE